MTDACIAVDPWFIVSAAPEQSSLVRTAREVNDAKPDFVIDKLLPQVRRIQDVRIAALGLAFKPNIDELPADLAGLANVALTELDQAVREADIVLLLVDHIDVTRLDRSLLAQKIVHDTRGVWC